MSFPATDSFFGLPVPALGLSLCMLFVLFLALCFRTACLSLVTLANGTMSIQFRRLAQQLKCHHYLGICQAEEKSAKEGAIKAILQEHWHLCEVVADLDSLLAPSSLLFLGSDVALVVSLISYIISGTGMEATLGLYITNTMADMATFVIYGVGAIGILLWRIGGSALLNHQVGRRLFFGPLYVNSKFFKSKGFHSRNFFFNNRQMLLFRNSIEFYGKTIWMSV